MKKATAVHEIHLSPKAVVPPGKSFKADAEEVDALIAAGSAKPFEEQVEEVVTAETETVVAKGGKGKGGKGKSGDGL